MTAHRLGASARHVPLRTTQATSALAGLRRIRMLAIAIVFAGFGGVVADSYAQDLPKDWIPVRDALLKYRDPVVAVRDGYFSTLGCVKYPNGGMGVHFLNAALIGPVPDPMRPQILVYEPVGDKLVLVAAEWFIPLATGVKEHPVLFGQRFDGPMAGHEPLMPTELHHYDLHVWLFKSNPAGLFNAVNPRVRCPAGRYTLLEHPTAKVAPPQ